MYFWQMDLKKLEGLTVVDVLRRAGAEVEMVSVMDRKEITGAHGIKVEADRMIEEAGEADLYVLPGGMPGTLHLKEHAGLCRLLNQAEKESTLRRSVQHRVSLENWEC